MVKFHFTKENMPTPEEFRRMLDEALMLVIIFHGPAITKHISASSIESAKV